MFSPQDSGTPRVLVLAQGCACARFERSSPDRPPPRLPVRSAFGPAPPSSDSAGQPPSRPPRPERKTSAQPTTHSHPPAPTMPRLARPSSLLPLDQLVGTSTSVRHYAAKAAAGSKKKAAQSVLASRGSGRPDGGAGDSRVEAIKKVRIQVLPGGVGDCGGWVRRSWMGGAEVGDEMVGWRWEGRGPRGGGTVDSTTRIRSSD